MNKQIEEIRQAAIFGVRPKRSFRKAAAKYLKNILIKAALIMKLYTFGNCEMVLRLFHENQIQTTNVIKNLYPLQNIGIAALTSAQKLHEILFSKEMINLR